MKERGGLILTSCDGGMKEKPPLHCLNHAKERVKKSRMCAFSLIDLQFEKKN